MKFSPYIDLSDPSLQTATLIMPLGVLDLSDDSPFTMRRGHGEFNPICCTALPSTVWSL